MISKLYYKISNKDYIFFLIGMFFLPSAISLSGIFLFLSFLIQTFKRKNEFFADELNKITSLIVILMLISVAAQIFFSKSIGDNKIQNYLYLIGLFNWLPFFWIFWAAQGFLKNRKERDFLSLIICFSTLPVIFSGIGQYFFNWLGPLTFLNGFIVWYQRPIDEISGLTGLFNHANYAGSWLTIVLPLSISQSFSSSKNIFKDIFLRMILFGIFLCIFLTNSRNAWGSSLLTIFFLYGNSSLKYLFPSFLFLISLISITTQNIFKGFIQEFIRSTIPPKIWLEFTNEGFKNLDASRLQIFNYAINLICKNPFFGTGSGSFPIFFELETGFWKGHPHNIFLEFAISYGIPCTLIFIYFLFNILFPSFKFIFKLNSDNSYFVDKAIWTSAMIFLISQLVDVQYFDGRISIIFWILLAGLKCIIDESKALKTYKIIKDNF